LSTSVFTGAADRTLQNHLLPISCCQRILFL